jgi:Zn-dependent protease with chaperone function
MPAIETNQNVTMQSKLQSMQTTIGNKLADALFTELAEKQGKVQSIQADNPWSLWLAYALACFVYILSTGFFIAGVVILVLPWPNWLVGVCGVVLVLLGVLARPRFSHKPDYILNPSEYPALHALCAQIAAKLGSPQLKGIGISADFGANYRNAGWRGERFIELGAPYMAMLTPEERVAVIAHELAHGANGDALRSLFLHNAVGTVANWAQTLEPESIGRSGERVSGDAFVSLLAIPFELMMYGLSKLLFGFVQLFYLLVLRQSQRAEYYADRLAAGVSGAIPLSTALKKTYFFDLVQGALGTHSLPLERGKTPETYSAVIARALKKHYAIRLTALDAESRKNKWRADSTHPPTALRVEMLKNQSPFVANMLADDRAIARINEEFDRIIASKERAAMNQVLEDMEYQGGNFWKDKE